MKTIVKIWFCLAAATIAATVADSIVEFASNHGWFGPGDFTDHSSWVVGPALLTGLIFIALYVCMRARQILGLGQKERCNWLRLTSDVIEKRTLSLVPFIFGLQILALFVMEKSEQLAVYGHGIPGGVWLGGPVIASLAIHLVFCCLITVGAAWLVRALARATVQFVHLVRLFATLRERGLGTHYLVRTPEIIPGRSVRARWRIGERAPPFLPA
jgi:hypothetical protein